MRAIIFVHWEKMYERYEEDFFFSFVFIWNQCLQSVSAEAPEQVVSLSQEPADLSKQFPDLAEDFHVPRFFAPDQFFSSVFRISSCGLQLWTHYDVGLCSFVQL